MHAATTYPFVIPPHNTLIHLAGVDPNRPVQLQTPQGVMMAYPYVMSNQHSSANIHVSANVPLVATTSASGTTTVQSVTPSSKQVSSPTPTLSIDKDQLRRFRVVEDVISHSRVSSKQLGERLANILCSLHDAAHITINQLALTLALLDKRMLGASAYSVGRRTLELLEQDDVNGIVAMIKEGKKVFVELYDNNQLTRDQRAALQRQLARERWVNHIRLTQFPELARAYEQACSYESGNTAACFLPFEGLAPKLTVVDGSIAYEYTTDQLLGALATDHINIHTSQPFSAETMELLSQRFSKELCMWKRGHTT